MLTQKRTNAMSYQKSRPIGGKSGRKPPHGWGRNVATSDVNWDDIDPATIYEAICAATQENDAILFGRTSDGGVMHLRWYLAGESYDQYPKTSDEAEDCLQAIILTYNAPQPSEPSYPTQTPPQAPSRAKKASSRAG